MKKSEERRGVARSNTRGACRACGCTELLDRHHVNENHDDNSSGNLMLLCKHCHMEAGRLGVDEFQRLLALVDDHPDLREQLRQTSELWHAEITKRDVSQCLSPARQLPMGLETQQREQRPKAPDVPSMNRRVHDDDDASQLTMDLQHQQSPPKTATPGPDLASLTRAWLLLRLFGSRRRARLR